MRSSRCQAAATRQTQNSARARHGADRWGAVSSGQCVIEGWAGRCVIAASNIVPMNARRWPMEGESQLAFSARILRAVRPSKPPTAMGNAPKACSSSERRAHIESSDTMMRDMGRRFATVACKIKGRAGQRTSMGWCRLEPAAALTIHADITFRKPVI